MKVDIPFTPEEAARFRAYLAREDKKAGRFVRTLVLRALDGRSPDGAMERALRALSLWHRGSDGEPSEAWLEDFRRAFGMELGEGDSGAWMLERVERLNAGGEPVRLELGGGA